MFFGTGGGGTTDCAGFTVTMIGSDVLPRIARFGLSFVKTAVTAWAPTWAKAIEKDTVPSAWIVPLPTCVVPSISAMPPKFGGQAARAGMISVALNVSVWPIWIGLRV